MPFVLSRPHSRGASATARHASRGCGSGVTLPPARRCRPQALDDRGRGYGGFHASCGEENLLRLPCDRYRDHRDILTHEFAHTCLSWGLGSAFEARGAAAPRCRGLFFSTGGCLLLCRS